MSQAQKLLQLRAKTDRQLVILIENTIGRGAHNDPSALQREISALLPLIPRHERRRLQRKLQQARHAAA